MLSWHFSGDSGEPVDSAWADHPCIHLFSTHLSSTHLSSFTVHPLLRRLFFPPQASSLCSSSGHERSLVILCAAVQSAAVQGGAGLLRTRGRETPSRLQIDRFCSPTHLPFAVHFCSRVDILRSICFLCFYLGMSFNLALAFRAIWFALLASW